MEINDLLLNKQGNLKQDIVKRLMKMSKNELIEVIQYLTIIKRLDEEFMERIEEQLKAMRGN
jgi:hypothetical protein